MESLEIKTVEMHTGGEPVRIVVSGMPPIIGKTIIEKMNYIRDNLDYIRKMLMNEPRGHSDMFGVILVEPDTPEADLGCIFIHNGGYATMCGHVSIAVGRYAVDYGIVKNLKSPETEVTLQCPCGLVKMYVEYSNGKSGITIFKSVPAYVYQLDLEIIVPGFGTTTVDISYGGGFYAVLSASKLGLDLTTSSVEKLKDAGEAVKDAVNKSLKLTHPEGSDLAFMFGVILTDGNDEFSDEPTTQVSVFGHRQVDRSPCGSGTTARVAQQIKRGYMKLNQQRKYQSVIGSVFTGEAIQEVKYGPYDAVIVKISGRSYKTGTSVYTVETDDETGKGFLLS
ncbi:Trans-L-3-hydroxyproline dehydratase [Mactra antiquata]